MIEFVHSFLEDVELFDAKFGEPRPSRLSEAKDWFTSSYINSRRYIIRQTLRRLQFYSQLYGLDDFGNPKVPEGVDPETFKPVDLPPESPQGRPSSSSSPRRRKASPAAAKQAVNTTDKSKAQDRGKVEPDKDKDKDKDKEGKNKNKPNGKRESPPKILRAVAVTTQFPKVSYREGDARRKLDASEEEEERPQQALERAAAVANLPLITEPDQRSTQPLSPDHLLAEPTLPFDIFTSLPDLSPERGEKEQEGKDTKDKGSDNEDRADSLPLKRTPSATSQRRPLVLMAESEPKRIKTSASAKKEPVINLDRSDEAVTPTSFPATTKAYSRRLFHDPELESKSNFFDSLEIPSVEILLAKTKEKGKKRGSTDESWSANENAKRKKEMGKKKKPESTPKERKRKQKKGKEGGDEEAVIDVEGSDGEEGKHPPFHLTLGEEDEEHEKEEAKEEKEEKKKKKKGKGKGKAKEKEQQKEKEEEEEEQDAFSPHRRRRRILFG